MPFVEITDARDGLNPILRRTLFLVQEELRDKRFMRSSKALRTASDMFETNVEEIFDVLVDTTWPRSELPLIDGQGMFAFPVAHPDFSEIRLSDFCANILNCNANLDVDAPLPIPVPYALVNGTLGYAQSISKIPSHNLGEIIEATIALIQDPKLETEQLLQYINGPDLLVGGTIENYGDLHKIYESGVGTIKVVVESDTINGRFFDDARDYSFWYGMKARKVRNEDAYRLEIPYYALLNDGAETRLCSLKDILQLFVDFYKSCNAAMSDEELCQLLLKYKELTSSRMTQF